MSIELLWIIPIVSAAMVILILIFNLQKKNYADSGLRNLKREVEEYNTGIADNKGAQIMSEESRLNKIENTIQLVSTMLSNQQKTIENFHGKDDTLEKELNDLKEKLKELQEEYDITISENYSLRARLNKVEQHHSHRKTSKDQSKTDLTQDTDTIDIGKVLNMKVYKERPTLNPSKPSELDDTSEINLAKYKN